MPILPQSFGGGLCDCVIETFRVGMGKDD